MEDKTVIYQIQEEIISLAKYEREEEYNFKIINSENKYNEPTIEKVIRN